MLLVAPPAGSVGNVPVRDLRYWFVRTQSGAWAGAIAVTVDPSTTTENGEVRCLLITECLQNDFFLNPDCRLYLSDPEVKKMLVEKRSHEEDVFEAKDGHRRVKAAYLRKGPLGRFLEATIGMRLREDGPKSVLHVVNIRDWHEPNESYDQERRVVGRHCEAGRWGAAYIDGLEDYLSPTGYYPDGRARFCSRGGVRIYHVHSDSIFDFRPRWTEDPNRTQPKFKTSRLERLLDVLVAGTNDQVERFADTLEESYESDRKRSQALEAIAREAIGTSASELPSVYIAVIGVYSDVKIPMLLAGLRTRYLIPNLAVSDTLTASRALERHLVGLDFADKLLRVEVIHGISDLAAYVGCELEVDDESEITAAPDFQQYRTYFANKQNVLAYQREREQDYEELTEERSVAVYRTISRANVFLLLLGGAFLLLALVGSILNLVSPEDFDWQIVAVTGGLGLAGVVAVFFTRPIRDLQLNLNNLASFKMILEGHSLKEAFTRYHLTTPEVLREVGEAELDTSLSQIEALRRQLDVIDQSHKSDYDALGRFVGLQAGEMSGGSAGGNGAAEPVVEPQP
jgi:hypothetical protein